MSKATYNILMGGGDTIVTSHRQGNRSVQVTTDQAQKIVHLSGFAYSCTELRLIQLCTQLSIELDRVQFATHMFGPLEGQPKGFAWLECPSAEMAQFAIQTLNNYSLDGKILKAELYIPDTGNTQIRGFAHLKRKNKDDNNNINTNNNNTTTSMSNVTIDGVPYSTFVELCAKLDDGVDDDSQAIFGLPSLRLNRDGEIELDPQSRANVSSYGKQ